jgi:hypothetical protein
MSFLMGMLGNPPAAQVRRTQPLPEATPARTRTVIAPADADFLERLDRGETGPYDAVSPADAEIYAAYDDLADTLQREGPVRRDTGRSGRAPDPSGAARQPADRPAEREARPRRETARQRVAARAQGPGQPSPAPRVTRRRVAEQQPAVVPVPRRSSGLLSALVVALVVVVAVVVGALWLLSTRVSVTVYAPEARVHEVPIADEVIPYDPNPQPASSAVVQAAPVTAEATYTVTGQVANQAISPTGRAHGVVTIVNTIEQALTLPEGTEFVGTNAQGAEVRLAIDAPQTIPGATTTASISGRTTTYGQAQVAVTARSPGAASNVPQNGIKQILLPGQNLITCGSSNFICQNEPIEGGTDEPQWIVSEADVQRVLGDALTGLYNAGVLSLREQTAGGSSVIDPSTINPDDKMLGQPENYEPPLVTPAIGQPADPNTRQFTVTVRTRFNALAVPSERLLLQQLATVTPAHFAQRNPPLCAASEVPAPRIDQAIWDGVSLKVSGSMVCTPQAGIAPEVRLQVRDALRGKSRAEAVAALDQLQQQGLIGSYSLPADATQMPPFDPLLDINFVEVPAAGQ